MYEITTREIIIALRDFNKIIKIIDNEFDVNEKLQIKYRLGLYDGKVHSLEETAKLWGVCRERVRRDESKHLEKIKMSLNKKYYEEKFFRQFKTRGIENALRNVNVTSDKELLDLSIRNDGDFTKIERIGTLMDVELREYLIFKKNIK